MALAFDDFPRPPARIKPWLFVDPLPDGVHISYDPDEERTTLPASIRWTVRRILPGQETQSPTYLLRDARLMVPITGCRCWRHNRRPLPRFETRLAARAHAYIMHRRDRAWGFHYYYRITCMADCRKFPHQLPAYVPGCSVRVDSAGRKTYYHREPEYDKFLLSFEAYLVSYTQRQMDYTDRLSVLNLGPL